MRIVYSVLFFLLIPFILLRLLLRSIKAPDYRRRWHERLGFYPINPQTGVIWFHAVSVGEAEAVFPLIKRFQQLHPDLHILVTTTTPTGSARVQAVLHNTIQHVYLPYDIPFIVKRFLRNFRPVLAVIMETELWPNLYHYCSVDKIPVYVINARLSEKSAKGYRKLPSLIQPLLANIQQIAVQSPEDAQRFMALGAKTEQVKIYGNIKFDLAIPDDTINTGKKLKTTEFKERFVWLAASTHYGEEQLLINAYLALKKTIPALMLVIAPRHPERFSEVEKLCKNNGLSVIARTAGELCQRATDVYLADTMGELKMLYAACDIAFVGGSLVPVGGHNILEAMAAGAPVLFGAYMANFKEIAGKALQHKAAIQCLDQEAIIQAVKTLHAQNETCVALINNGKSVIEQNRGAIIRLYEMLMAEIEKNYRYK